MEKIVDRVGYEGGGMFPSELLLFIYFCDKRKVDTIIESGRYRGYSTAILSEYFVDKDIDIYSIERNKNTEVEEIARKKVDNNNVEFKYGDSTEVMKRYVGGRTTALIDGPKGDKAVLFAAKLMKHNDISLVAIHDLYRNRFARNMSELIFNHKYYSDNEKYVGEFKYMDEKCWHRAGDNTEPFQWDRKDIGSYARTLGVFLNNDPPVNKQAEENIYEYLDNKQTEYKYNNTPLYNIRNQLQTQINEGGPVQSTIAGGILKIGRKILP